MGLQRAGHDCATSLSMVRWVAAAPGPSPWGSECLCHSSLGGNEWILLTKRWAHHLNLWPENCREKMQFPFRMSLLAQLLLPNINWQKGLHEALSAQALCWVGGCWIWSSEQQKGSSSSWFRERSLMSMTGLFWARACQRAHLVLMVTLKSFCHCLNFTDKELELPRS